MQPTLAPELTPEQVADLSDEIRALAAERNAVILAHNYQLPEVQDVAHYLGDSLGLSRQAAATEADAIAFCGVHFMAETASILSPEKTVLIPDLDAGCSLADSIDADQLRAWKAEHPGALVVMYVNTSAEVKAETDYCCTSSNAVKVVERIWAEHGPETEILFGPDMWLGAFVERETGLLDDPERRSRFHVWDGECHVHAGIRPDDIARTRAEHPEAEFLIHPECGCSTQAMEYVAAGDIDPGGVHMLSTSGMQAHVEAHPDGEFIVATENGMLYPLQQAAPKANLIEANRMAFCKYMKMITLPKLRDSLAEMKFEVSVEAAIAERAKIPIERMVSIG
ncbi:MAG TPA: quinolinate synthase NadA [Solirubrobacterales bacterium]|nr:quinolinate synthase NadA [Solirubrobacterales bacterium]